MVEETRVSRGAGRFHYRQDALPAVLHHRGKLQPQLAMSGHRGQTGGLRGRPRLPASQQGRRQRVAPVSCASAAIVSANARQGFASSLQGCHPAAHPDTQLNAVNPRSEPWLLGQLLGLAAASAELLYAIAAACRKRSGPLAGLGGFPLLGPPALFCLQARLWPAARLMSCVTVAAADPAKGAVSSSAAQAVLSVALCR